MAGNATITLFDGKKLTTFEVWLQSISTSSTNQFLTQQTRDGISWLPIRRAEMFANFTIVWSLVSLKPKGTKPDLGFEDIDPTDGFSKLNKFQDAINAHQIAYVNGTTAATMELNYYNNSDPTLPTYNTIISKNPLQPLKFNGWIQIVEKQFVRFKNYFVTNYTMNILTKNIANTPPSSLEAGSKITYAPSAYDQEAYGASWVDLYATGIVQGAINTKASSINSQNGGVPGA
jgi:hypothetical protein